MVHLALLWETESQRVKLYCFVVFTSVFERTNKMESGHYFSSIFPIIALDNCGRTYDKNGNFGVWWKQSTVKTYLARGKCFMKEVKITFKNYFFPKSQLSMFNISIRATYDQDVSR